MADGVEMTSRLPAGRVLLVDDEADLRLVLRTSLQADGWEVLEASDVETAVECVRRGDPDVVLVDLVLGEAARDGEDGGTRLVEALKSDPATAWIPVVVLSGRSEPAETIRLLDAGAEDFIVKPADLHVVRARLAAARRVAVEHRRLVATERRFQAILSNSSDVVSVIDGSGRLSYVSPRTEEVLGRRPGDREGASIFDYIHPDDLGRTTEQLSIALRQPGLLAPFETRIRHEDGTYRLFEVSANNMLEDPDVAGIIVSSRDVTDRRRIEEALADIERGFERMFEHAATAISLVGLDGRHLPSTRPTARWLATRPASSLG